MNREMTKREKVLLLILAVILLGLVYNLLVFQPVKTSLASAADQSQELQDEIQTEAARGAHLAQMRDKLQELKKNETAGEISIPEYDNIQDLVTELNRVLAAASDYDLNFTPPKTDDKGLVRRVIGMTFTCGRYADARSILSELYSCRYRCQIGDLQLKSENSESVSDLSSGPVQVSLTVTFYEMNPS